MEVLLNTGDQKLNDEILERENPVFVQKNDSGNGRKTSDRSLIKNAIYDIQTKQKSIFSLMILILVLLVLAFQLYRDMKDGGNIPPNDIKL